MHAPGVDARENAFRKHAYAGAMSINRRRFRILKEIAEGGFGKVYLAEQINSDGFSRIVAIKLLHAKWSTHDEVVKRTRDEARVLGRIRHQHIVKVEDLTSIEGKCAIVMEYLEGVDLKWMSTFLKDRKQDFPRAALFEIILAVASALDAAFNAIPLQATEPLRAIHRDIKPSNVFVTVAGGVKVLDFGTARANFAEREAKTQALAFGSQGYMAPERMLGEEDTPAADIFSLGITLYELLTSEGFGRIPPRPNKFQKKVDERVASVKLEGDPEWAQQVRDTLRLMLSYSPVDRPSAAQLVEIMDLLAQEAKDMGLRRFCRTLVSEAKDALPPLDTGDGLTGTVVDEDVSGTGANQPSVDSAPRMVRIPPPPMDGMSHPTVLDNRSVEDRMGGRTPPGVTGRAMPANGGGTGTLQPAGTLAAAGGPTSKPVPPAPPDVKTVVPGQGGRSDLTDAELARIESDEVPPTYEEPAAYARQDATVLASGVISRDTRGTAISRAGGPATGGGTAPAGGGGGVRILGVAVFGGGVVAALGIGAAILIVVVLVAFVAFRDPGPPVTPPGIPAAGGHIVRPDGRATKSVVPTVLTYGDSAGGTVDLRGPGGFHATWDGRAKFDLGPAGEGGYTATITTASNAKFYLRKFTIDGKKSRCAFAFDPNVGEWSGGCD